MKRRRVYYNRAEDGPQIWSIDEGDTGTEINVQCFQIKNCLVMPGANLSAEYPEPRAWLEVFASLEIVGGAAVLDGADKG